LGVYFGVKRTPSWPRSAVTDGDAFIDFTCLEDSVPRNAKAIAVVDADLDDDAACTVTSVERIA
jgi:hypothetical protein